jgi:hypothetical protein
MSFDFSTCPLTRRCSWYTYSYLPLVWVSRDVAHPVIVADTSPQRPVFLGVQGAKAGRMYQDLHFPRRTYLTSLLQAGIRLNSLHSKEVSHALKKATSDR